VKLVPVNKSSATKPNGGEDVQHQVFTNLTAAGYTNMKIRYLHYQTNNKSGDPVKMPLTADSLTIFIATEANGQGARTAAAGHRPPFLSDYVMKLYAGHQAIWPAARH
jgi:hypothetical protein